mmetsp:Transcript_18062/g.52760  ORF Transcript_18062/g.52760 Transcript_18062/m.52760 type:complete len:234 (-) Transcript_18062:591-1292(-)
MAKMERCGSLCCHCDCLFLLQIMPGLGLFLSPKHAEEVGHMPPLEPDGADGKRVDELRALFVVVCEGSVHSLAPPQGLSNLGDRALVSVGTLQDVESLPEGLFLTETAERFPGWVDSDDVEGGCTFRDHLGFGIWPLKLHHSFEVLSVVSSGLPPMQRCLEGKTIQDCLARVGVPGVAVKLLRGQDAILVRVEVIEECTGFRGRKLEPNTPRALDQLLPAQDSILVQVHGAEN